MTALEAKGEHWFDLELTDGKINTEIKIQAVKIFYFWQQYGIIKVPNQKITRWRPNKGIVLVSKINDFTRLMNMLPQEIDMPKKYSELFEFENVYRIYLF